MNNREILRRLDLGKSVAENDQNLQSYFVPTIALDEFVADKYDIIRGVKGSGKSAILRVVSSNQNSFAELTNTALHVATEHTGDTSFKRAFDTLSDEGYEEGSLINAWKAYFLNLILDEVEHLSSSSERTDAIRRANACGLRFRSDNKFKKVFWSLLRFIHVKSFTVGMDTIQAEFPDAPPEFWTKKEEIIDFSGVYHSCVQAFAAANRRCWLLIDRLDAIFQDKPVVEQVALRSLLIAYKDFMGHTEIRPKLFMRSDLFDQVTANAMFRELTHVKDRTSPPIDWDFDKLKQMIMERFAFNKPIREKYGFERDDIKDPEMREAIFISIFPKQVDQGERRPDAWNWMLSRITDGNRVVTPRDLHDLVQIAAQRQAELLTLEPDQDREELISSLAIKQAHETLSEDKIATTLKAENPDLVVSIQAFYKQKAEQNSETLAQLLGSKWQTKLARLASIGFLEKTGETWKVPMLYRPGLEIIRGAAFSKEADTDV